MRISAVTILKFVIYQYYCIFDCMMKELTLVRLKV